MSDLTKKALAKTLKELMDKKSLDKITIKEITDNCGVNRQTFYYHFNDIFKLIEWIFKEEAVKNIDKYRSYATWQKGFLLIFKYIKENLTFCTNCFNSSGRDYLEMFLREITRDLLIGVVNEVANSKPIPESDKKFISNFYTFAFIGIVANWIREGAKDDPADIINHINMLIEGDIIKAVSKN